MEGKKISFGFMKTKKADKPLAHNNDERKDYIECVEEQSIKIVGGEDVPVNEPLVIPLKPNTLMKSDRFKEIASKVESELEESSIKHEIIDVPMDDPLAENLTLDQMAERELLQEAKKEVVVQNPTMSIPSSTKGVAEGEIESTLDDYESVPVQEFGVAMLRGMGWKPGQSRASNPVERASQPSVYQVITLLNFLEKYPALAIGLPRAAFHVQRMKAQRAWEKLAAILNERGASKNWRQWAKYWKDKKSAIRRKIAKNNSGVESDFAQLTEVEERMYALIGNLSAGDRRRATQYFSNQQESPVHESPETEQPILLEQQESPVHEPPEAEQHIVLVMGHDGTLTRVADPQCTQVQRQADPLTSTSNPTSSQTTTHKMTIPSLKGNHVHRTHAQNTSRKPHVMQTNPPSSRNSATGRRSILRTALVNGPHRSSLRSTQFSKIAERFLKVEEQRLEHDRRTTNVLQTVTRVVSRVLERDAENNRMMSEAMLSIGEGLKLLAEAVKSNSSE